MWPNLDTRQRHQKVRMHTLRTMAPLRYDLFTPTLNPRYKRGNARYPQKLWINLWTTCRHIAQIRAIKAFEPICHIAVQNRISLIKIRFSR